MSSGSDALRIPATAYAQALCNYTWTMYDKMDDNKLEIDCRHGKGIASIICCHQLNSVDPVGFIENSFDPDDLQAWCYACEYLYEQEGDNVNAIS